jgi:hypothetical protein
VLVRSAGCGICREAVVDLDALRSRDIASTRDCLRQALDIAEIVVDLRRDSDPHPASPCVQLYFDLILDEERHPQTAW